jgi:hypothetical protein
MSNDNNEITPSQAKNRKNKFNIKSHVEWGNNASTRTRAVSVVLVIGSVLVLIGFWNSVKWSWPRDRIKKVYDTGDRSIYPVLEIDAHPKIRSDSYFVGNDFVDSRLTEFTGSLIDPKGFLEQYIRDKLRATKIEKLEKELAEFVRSPDNFPKGSERKSALLSLLAQFFNEIIKDQELYQGWRFQNTHLRSDAQKKIESGYKPGGNDLIRFNRILLEDYFPDAIIRSRDVIPEEDFRKEMQRALVNTYIENVRYVRIPFFGIAFDVNDLGIIGGGGLLTILVMYLFCLSRELKNLQYSFGQAAESNGKLYRFYHALAMNQVLTMPDMHELRSHGLLAKAVVLVPIFSVLILTFGVGYDCSRVGHLSYSFSEAWPTLTIEVLLLLVAWFVAIVCVDRIVETDEIWLTYYNRAKDEKPESNPPTMKKGVQEVEKTPEFPTDADVTDLEPESQNKIHSHGLQDKIEKFLGSTSTLRVKHSLVLAFTSILLICLPRLVIFSHIIKKDWDKVRTRDIIIAFVLPVVLYLIINLTVCKGVLSKNVFGFVFYACLGICACSIGFTIKLFTPSLQYFDDDMTIYFFMAFVSFWLCGLLVFVSNRMVRRKEGAEPC